jgi:nucleotide-binding universal stress UspA family protein
MYQIILVPLDGSEFAECALDHAINLSRMTSVREIILLHVLDPLLWCQGGRDFIAFRNFHHTQATKYLEKIKSRLNLEGTTITSEIIEGGIPASSIITYARDHEIDLVIMTSRGRTGLKKLMLGSVALSVLHDSHIPILLIRPESCKT